MAATCRPDGTCDFANFFEGVKCDDGIACSEGDYCRLGQCTSMTSYCAPMGAWPAGAHDAQRTRATALLGPPTATTKWAAAVPGVSAFVVAADGTIYATNTGVGGATPDPATWQVWKVTRDGAASVFVQGPPLRRPNGVAVDAQGNIVVVNIDSSDVLTFAPDAKLLKTETAAQAGNDGLVIMPDGTKYVSSVLNGGVSKMSPGKPAELIARNIPNAASMCYDAGANQLVIPMNPNNGLAFIRLP